MRLAGVIILGTLWLLTLSSCSDDTTCVCTETSFITGTVHYADSLNAAGGAAVFMSKDGPFAFTDTVYADDRGSFQFRDVSAGPFHLLAGKFDLSGVSSYTHISPISGRMDYPGRGIFYAGDILLYEISGQSSITGQVVFPMPGPEYTPVDSADVLLYDLSRMPHEIVDSVLTDEHGQYSFTDVETGNYVLWAGKGYTVAESDPFFCDGATSYAADVLVLRGPPVRKPAIYIYPDEDAYFDVRLVPNNGTVITETVPEYNSGWNVFVETSGRIDHRHDYLFYEAELRDMPTLRGGWCLHRDRLAAELPHLLRQIGLNESETEDLLEYWLDHLTRHVYYAVYPLFDRALDDMVELHVSPSPDAVLRFWLFFIGREEPEPLPPPIVPGFSRGATTVIEWGGVLVD